MHFTNSQVQSTYTLLYCSLWLSSMSIITTVIVAFLDELFACRGGHYRPFTVMIIKVGTENVHAFVLSVNF